MASFCIKGSFLSHSPRKAKESPFFLPIACLSSLNPNPKDLSLSTINQMDRSNLVILITIIASTISLSSPIASSSASSIYDVLRSHGLPTGLLPKGITNFTIDPTSGRFEVRLNEACDAKFETDVHYDWNVSGTLGYGEIAEMSGVSAQDLFLWFPVKGIRVDVPSSGLIYFDVGVLRKQFSLSFFETPRDCTAGDPISPPAELVLLKDDGRIESIWNA